MRGALFQTAAVEVGAVGIATVLASSLLDIQEYTYYIYFLFSLFFLVFSFLFSHICIFGFFFVFYFDGKVHFTGILGAGVVAVMGMGILPYKRSAIKKLMRKRISELQEKLSTALENHFTR